MPPPFPVVAPPSTGKTTPPIPHIRAKEEVAVPEPTPLPRKPPLWKSKTLLIATAGVVVVIAAASGWFFFLRPAPPPPPPAKRPAAPMVAAPVPKPAAPAAALADKPAQSTPGLSETQNAIAHAPVNAINKARDVIAKREASGQGRDAINAIMDSDAPTAPGAKPAAAPQNFQTSTSIAPGVSATNDNVTAAAEASPAFRSFVANAKINGVFQGSPPRVMLNGRLTRAGDLVEATLGVVFDSIDPDKKLILFKDKAGATVTRRY